MELVVLIPAARGKGRDLNRAHPSRAQLFWWLRNERLPAATAVARVPSLKSPDYLAPGVERAEVVGGPRGRHRGSWPREGPNRTLTVLRKGGKVVTVPLEPRTARAGNPATGEPLVGPIFVTANGQRLDRHVIGRIVRGVARRASIDKRTGPHTLRHAFITAAPDAGVPLREVQEAASQREPPDDHALRPSPRVA